MTALATGREPSVEVGEIVDAKYQVVRLLGVGGMGFVVEAEHLELGHHLALKFMLPKELGDAEAVGRFAREARAAARLQSQHVARVFDVGRFGNRGPYIAMELLKGQDLGSRLREGPLAPEEAVLHVLQACEALAEAHGLGVVHRDVKPQNLFVARRNDGEQLIKVLDFGIAKVADRRRDDRLTSSVALFGSPEYMAPEQIDSAHEVTPASDQWSLGVCLFELLTGRLPFEGSGTLGMVAAIATEQPADLGALRPDLPAPLVAAVMRCLRKDPSARFSDVAALAEALGPFAGRPGARTASSARIALHNAMSTNPVHDSTPPTWKTVPAPAPGRRPRVLVWVGAGLTLVSGAAVMVALFRGAPVRAHDVRPASRLSADLEVATAGSPAPSAVPSAAPPAPQASASFSAAALPAARARPEPTVPGTRRPPAVASAQPSPATDPFGSRWGAQ